MTSKEIAKQFANELADGKTIVFNVEENNGKFKYHVAQKRKAAIASGEVQAIAALRPTKFEDQIFRAWVNGVSAEDHAANIEKGFITVDAEGNYIPSVLEGLHVVIVETTDLMEKRGDNYTFIYDKDGVKTYLPSIVKQAAVKPAQKDADGKPVTEIVTSGGKLVYRRSTLSTTQEDTLLPNDAVRLTKDQYEAIREQQLEELNAVAV